MVLYKYLAMEGKNETPVESRGERTKGADEPFVPENAQMPQSAFQVLSSASRPVRSNRRA